MIRYVNTMNFLLQVQGRIKRPAQRLFKRITQILNSFISYLLQSTVATGLRGGFVEYRYWQRATFKVSAHTSNTYYYHFIVNFKRLAFTMAHRNTITTL